MKDKCEKLVEVAFSVALSALVLAFMVITIALAIEFTDWLLVNEIRTIVLFVLGITIYQVFHSCYKLFTIHKE